MTRKYILKPGKHQFAPRSPAIHDNDNLSDEAAAWYLEKYPHIKTLFTTIPDRTPIKKLKRARIKSGKITQSANTTKQPENNEDVPAPN